MSNTYDMVHVYCPAATLEARERVAHAVTGALAPCYLPTPDREAARTVAVGGQAEDWIAVLRDSSFFYSGPFRAFRDFATRVATLTASYAVGLRVEDSDVLFLTLHGMGRELTRRAYNFYTPDAAYHMVDSSDDLEELLSEIAQWRGRAIDWLPVLPRGLAPSALEAVWRSRWGDAWIPAEEVAWRVAEVIGFDPVASAGGYFGTDWYSKTPQPDPAMGGDFAMLYFHASQPD